MAGLLFLVMAASFGAGTLLAVAWPWARGARVGSLLAAFFGSVAALALGAVVLFTGAAWSGRFPGLLAPLGGLTFRVDPLGALFLAVIGFTGLAAALYGQGYLSHLDGQPRGRIVHALLNLFLAGMCMVAAAGNVVAFLFGWELMAVTSYLLVVSDPSQEDAPAAGLWYAAMTHAGFLALLAAFLILAQGGPLEFDAMRQHGGALAGGASIAVFVLGLVAFGSKAGMVPLHVWLPRAHPAAPSHVSALMSAAMVKLGIYGLIRLFFDLLPSGPAWWGGTVLAAGVVTALTGVLYSVAETNLKRVLAYSTIENVGVILVGLGFALLMRGYGYPALAAMGLAVCLLHTVNHAVFKSLLFLGAGAVIHGTHSGSLEAYGGLVKRMPQTAILFFIGALSVAALPPLNGFPSEWLTFQILVAGASHTAPELAIVLPLALAGVALAAGLAAVSAVRLFGITFLALPRSAEAAAAHEPAPIMRGAMAIPAVACVVLGLAPTLVLPRLDAIASSLRLPPAALYDGASLTLGLVGSRVWPVGVALVLLTVALAAAATARRRLGGARHLVGAVWNCGRILQSARTEYTAASFAEPLKRVFTGFYRPTQEVTIDVHPESRYFVKSIRVRDHLAPWIEQATYGPLVRATRWASLRTRRLQAGSLQRYLALLPLALLILLLLAQWIR
jgi:formate hydrogenlyase subunit 3/multisubunit Na+/H+ antiporter MnhD subunit